MKRHRSILVIVVIGWIIILFGYSLLYGGLQDGVEADDHGKVIGQIVAPETGEPVKEPFFINIFFSKDDKYPANLYRFFNETDNRGRIELELPPYIYYLQFYPLSSKSKYCMTPYPYSVEEKERDVIKVEPGKITYFKKKAIIGGILKLYIADMNNNRFNPQEKFTQKFNITSYITTDFYIGDVGESGALNDGEQIVYGLYEAIYRIDIEFEGLGFKDFKKDNILVEKGKTTEVIINLDLSDITGIEGVVTDAASVPVEEADISFAGIGISNDDTIRYKAFTNNDGYYKLTGMPEGKYFIIYYYSTQKGRLISNEYGYLVIKKNVLMHLDLQFEKTIAEMEKK
jgi:hypothetical protein